MITFAILMALFFITALVRVEHRCKKTGKDWEYEVGDNVFDIMGIILGGAVTVANIIVLMVCFLP